MSHRHSRLRGVLVVSTLTLLTTPAPALAHDELLSSTPARMSASEQAPSQVSLTFGAAVRAAASTVVVTDGAGTPRSDGSPALVDGTLVQQVDPGGAPGDWQLAYRVVSSDGHPITGSIDFTVAVSPSTTTPAPSTAPTALATEAPPMPLVTGEGGDPTRVLLMGGGLLLGLIAVVAFALRARRGPIPE